MFKGLHYSFTRYSTYSFTFTFGWVSLHPGPAVADYTDLVTSDPGIGVFACWVSLPQVGMHAPFGCLD